MLNVRDLVQLVEGRSVQWEVGSSAQVCIWLFNPSFSIDLIHDTCHLCTPWDHVVSQGAND